VTVIIKRPPSRKILRHLAQNSRVRRRARQSSTKLAALEAHLKDLHEEFSQIGVQEEKA